MTTAIKRRRGTTTQHSTFTGLDGELTIDTTKETVVVHDGATAGGFPLLRENLSNNTNVATLSGTQTFSGAKTFSSTITGSITGNAGTVTNGVYTSGDQTIGGVKTLSSNPIVNAGTANGVAYLNGSKVLTTGSALTFDGGMLALSSSGNIARFGDGTNTFDLRFRGANNWAIQYAPSTDEWALQRNSVNQYSANGSSHIWSFPAGEQMRLTSTGLGIGTSSPTQRLTVAGNATLTGTITTTANTAAVNIGSATGTSTRVDFSINGTDAATNARRWNIGTNLVGTAGNLEFFSNIVGLTATLNTSGQLETGIAGSASAPSFTRTGDLNTGIFFPAADTIAFAEGGVESMRIDASGNLGLGVTPSAWYSIGYSALQVRGSSLYGTTGNDTNLSSNAFVNTSPAWAYVSTGTATRYEQAAGAHRFYTAPSGTAGNAISFTQAMTLDASGNLQLGTTSALSAASGRTDLTINGSSIGAIISFGNGGVRRGYIWQDGTDLYFANQSNGSAIFITNNTERARIDSSGRLLVGTTSASGSTSNTASVVGGVFSSVSGTAAITAGTPVTLFTMPQGSAFFVTIRSANTNADDGISTYIVQRDNSNTFLTAIKVNGGASGRTFTLQLSGTSVQGVNSSGGETAAWSAMRIS